MTLRTFYRPTEKTSCRPIVYVLDRRVYFKDGLAVFEFVLQICDGICGRIEEVFLVLSL